MSQRNALIPLQPPFSLLDHAGYSISSNDIFAGVQNKTRTVVHASDFGRARARLGRGARGGWDPGRKPSPQIKPSYDWRERWTGAKVWMISVSRPAARELWGANTYNNRRKLYTCIRIPLKISQIPQVIVQSWKRNSCSVGATLRYSSTASWNADFIWPGIWVEEGCEVYY